MRRGDKNIWMDKEVVRSDDGEEKRQLHRRTTLMSDIVIHSPSTQQFIMVILTLPYESRMEQAYTYKKEKLLDLAKELDESGYKAKIMPIKIGARGFARSSAYGANFQSVATNEPKP
ncbi:polyprotein [Elysia marginata]|uniref:Polyprotein n=1 Tax=Elysia marginata TaxID=1093978 RepID=A0AAV4F9L4_9GAST|nr:polyprotein [Elysia marginata]